jgi:thiol-disulfide isomerase/thioredoxin
LLACSRAGSAAPPFTTTTQYGRAVRNEDFRGRTLLLTLWATWCPHCHAQLSAMDQVSSSYAAGRVNFLALSTDREGWDVVRPYLAETGFSLNVGLADRATQRAYGASGGIPITWVIDSSGIVVTDIPGALDAQSLREVIDRYAA